MKNTKKRTTLKKMNLFFLCSLYSFVFHVCRRAVGNFGWCCSSGTQPSRLASQCALKINTLFLGARIKSMCHCAWLFNLGSGV